MSGKLGRKDALYDARRTATLTLAAPVGTAAGGGDADTIDGFHAAASPTVGFLLALDASAQFPDSTIPAGIARDSEVTADIATHAALTDVHHVAFVGLEDNAGAVIPLAADDRIQIIDDNVINADAVGNTLALSIAQGQIDHGSIGGLGGDDHSQYVHISSARTITAQHSFSPASALPPFTLGANAQGQLVTGLRADQLNKSVSAGNGLTGGGMLTTNITVTLGTPSTTTVATNNAVTATSHTHQLDLSGRTLTAGSGLTGGGTLAADRTFNIGAGDGIDVAADSIAVDVTDILGTGLAEDGNNNIVLPTPGTLSVSSANAAAAPHTHTVTSSSNPGAAVSLLATDANGYLRLVRLGIGISPTTSLEVVGTARIDGDLQFVGAQSITTTAGDLTVVPTGDLVLDPAGNQVRMAADVTIQSNDFASQTTGWGISYAGSGDLRYLFVDEMHAKSFIADLEQALAGGQIICKSVAVVGKDFSIPTAGNTAYLWVEDLPGASDMAVFQANDIVRLRQFTRGAGSLTIADAWGVVTAYTDGTGGDDGLQRWTFTRSSGGDAGSATGTIEAGSLALDYGVSGNGFYEVNAIDGAWAENSPYAQIVTWATHPHSGKTVRVRTGNLKGVTAVTEYGMFAGDGVAATNKFFRVSDQNFEIHNLAVELYDASTKTVALDPSMPSFALGNPLPTGFGTGEGIWMGKDTTYKFRVGDPAGERVQWDPTNGLYIYDGDNQAAFYVKPDGSVWLSQLAISAQAGDFLFSQAVGLLLLGPGCAITPTSWTSLRGQVATLSGACLDEQGAFPGTRARQVEPACTNFVRNPSFEGAWNAWWNFYNQSGSGKETSTSRYGDACLKLVSSAATNPYIWKSGAITNPAQGDDYTVSAWIKGVGATIGKTARVMIRESGGAQGQADYYSSHLTLTAQWQRISVTMTVAENDRTALSVMVQLYCANTEYAYLDGIQLEKRDFATSVAIGDMGAGYSWGAGTEHESATSARTGTAIYTPAAGSIDAASGSISTRFKVPVWNTAGGFLWSAGNVNAEFDSYITSTGHITFRINNDSRCSTPAGAVTKDVWHLLVETWDSGADESKLYLDGLLIDTGTCGGAAPTLHTNLGIGYSAAVANTIYNLTGLVGEFASFDSILTAEEVAAIYARHAPLVDAGALERPGIYLLDGQFTLASATANEHVQLEAAGIGIYDGTGPTGVGRLLGGFVDTTGKVLDITSDDLGWFGYDNSNVLQVAWYGSGDDAGKVIAGGGNVVIDEDGHVITITSSADNFISLRDSGGSELGFFNAKHIQSGGLQMSTLDIVRKLTDANSGQILLGLIGSSARCAGGITGDGFAVGTLADDLKPLSLTTNILLHKSGVIYVNETANTKQTIGLTINQGANNDEIIALKSSDVAHGATDYVETDTYGRFRKYQPDAGGLQISGHRDSDAAAHGALVLSGWLAENVDTTKSTSGHALVEIAGYQTSGAGVGNTVADGNVLAILTRRGGSLVTLAIFDEDGDFYYDGSLNNYDSENDALAAWDLSHVLSGAWEQVIEYNAGRLEKMGIIGPPDKHGRRMVSNKRMTALLLGAVGQLYHRIADLETLH